MAYRVSVAGFEGPFDLLLQLVMRQKIDIGSVSISGVADQYLAEVARMGDVDLDVASDFVLVAATLLDLKAASLLSADGIDDEPERDEDDYEELTADEMRDVLVSRLMAYRTYKMASLALEARGLEESRMHPRTIGPDERFKDAAPDYLKNVTLEQLAKTCARFLGRRELVLLQSEHIAAKRMPLETRVVEVDEQVRARGTMMFSELIEDNPSTENKVVSTLALLELAKRDIVGLSQPELFADITIESHDATPRPESLGELTAGEE